MSIVPQTPPKLGKYTLVKKLGGGGMGRVYLATMSGPMEFEKKVVVKTILPALTQNKDYTQLFLNEARLGARLSHSAIASIHELGEENGLYYLVMEYVDGWTLRQAIRAAQRTGGKLSPARVAEIMARACEGLYYAHTLADKDGKPLGVVHRDLSPQNIMISREGDVKIIDFGVARSDLSTNETVAGTIKGKLSYMSPEQSRGERVDARSDIFALGVLIYESLTNVNPFDLDTPVSILRALDGLTPPELKTLDQDLGPFDPIVKRCLAKEKEHRYPDARELRMDLLGVMERARASQRDHLGSWMAALVAQQKSMPAVPGFDDDGGSVSSPNPNQTSIDMVDPFSHPHDPGADLPEPPGDELADLKSEASSLGEKATRLKMPAAVETVGARGAGPKGLSPQEMVAPTRLLEQAAPATDATRATTDKVLVDQNDARTIQMEAVNAFPSYPALPAVTVRRGPPRALLALAGVAVVGTVIAAALMLKKPAHAPLEAAPAPVAEKPAPPLPAPPAAPAAEPAPEAVAAATEHKDDLPPLPPPVENRLPSPISNVVVNEPQPSSPPVETAQPRGKRKHARAEATAAAPAPVAAPANFRIKPIGETHVADAYGNNVSASRSFSAAANLQVGVLLVQLKAAVTGGARTISVVSQPWAIASVDGVSRGKTPLAAIPLPDKGFQLELIRPGMDHPAVIAISPSEN